LFFFILSASALNSTDNGKLEISGPHFIHRHHLTSSTLVE